MFEKIINKVLIKLSHQYDNYNLTEKKKYVTITDSSYIYKETVINNFQYDKSKIVFGNYTHVRGNFQVFKQGGEIILGDYCYVGEGTYIWSSNRIYIGDRVLIAHNVNIHDTNSHPTNSQFRHLDYLRIIGFNTIDDDKIGLISKPIIIKNNAWIGFNSIILKGVTIGEGAIVGAGSVVTNDVPDFAVVAGNPAKIVKYTS